MAAALTIYVLKTQSVENVWRKFWVSSLAGLVVSEWQQPFNQEGDPIPISGLGCVGKLGI